MLKNTIINASEELKSYKLLKQSVFAIISIILSLNKIPKVKTKNEKLIITLKDISVKLLIIFVFFSLNHLLRLGNIEVI